ncbi:MAG: hypothetical protein K2O85_06860 [Helicobacter sp.]|nr:hypothetical protein [Helicobacter sp.]
MKKILVSGIIALSVISATSAAEVPSTTKQSTDDLLTIASAGALTSESAGVYQLNSAEMDDVQGGLRIKIGKAKITIKNFCFGSFFICK